MAFYSYEQSAPSYSHNPQPPSAFYPHHHQLQQQRQWPSPPGQMDTSGYLPPFLLGSPAPKSPSRSRTPGSLSSGLTPGFQGMRTSATHGGATTIDHSHLGLGSAKVDKKPPTAGGPPVQALYDQPSSSTPGRSSTPLMAASSPERRQLNFSLMNTASRSRMPIGNGVGVMGGPITPGFLGPQAESTPGTIGSLNTSTVGMKQRTPPSPAQMDPFYTQGETLTSEDDYHDCWVTVFGFPPAASSYILEQFSQYGTILKHVVTANGNWMHILFQSRLQAKKALSKNGKVYGNGIMVGVQPCIDKSVIEGSPPSSSSSSLATGSATPSTPSKRPTSIRPLTAAYQATSSAHQVAPSNPNTPQKSTGFFSKALEYMFGW